MRWIIWGVVCFGASIGGLPWQLPSSAVAGSADMGGELAEELSRVGFELSPGVAAKLPGELLPRTGLVPPAAIEELVGRHRWDRFAADSRLAPVSVTINPVMVQGSRVGHQVRAAFTLRTRLNDHLNQQDGSDTLSIGQVGTGGAVRPVTAEELKKVGIKPAADGNERFVCLEISLLNRIDLKGVIRIQRRVSPDSIEVAWGFDHRFDSLPDLATTATKAGSNELGERVDGPPEPYAGGGGIVTARELTSGDSTASGLPVVIVESRLVFAEPESWFGGSNLLRAKVPLITQEGVRTLRRRLKQSAGLSLYKGDLVLFRRLAASCRHEAGLWLPAIKEGWELAAVEAGHVEGQQAGLQR